MSANAETRSLLAWLALVAVTLASWWIGSNHGQEVRSSTAITYAVLLMAAIKVRVIVREFMEVRHAPKALRHLTDGWTVFIVVALLAIYSLNLSMPPV